MNKQYLESVISKEKIFYNLKKYIWIFVVCLVLALGVSIPVLLPEQSTEENSTEEENTEEEITRIMARNAIVELKWEFPVATDLDYKLRSEEYEKIRCLVTTTDFMKVVNDNLVEAQLDPFTETDIIVLEKISLDTYQVYVLSQCEDERLLTILETAIEYVFNKALSETSLVSYEIKERGDLSYPNIVAGRYYFYPVLEEEESEQENNVSNDDGFDKSRILSAIIIIILFLFGGALLLLLIITLDKKIYTKNDISRVLDLECLGDYTDSKHVNEKVKNIIGGKCKLQVISNLCFAACSKLEKSQELDKIVEYLVSIGISSKVVDDIISNENRFLELVDSSIILVVRSKVDSIDDVWELYSSIKQMGKEVEGFIIN